MESLTCIKSCGKNKLRFFETNRLVPCLGHRDYSSLFSPEKCPYTKSLRTFPGISGYKWCFNHCKSGWKKTQNQPNKKAAKKTPLKSLDNTNNKSCPFLNSNTTQTFSSSKKMIPWISGTTHTSTTSCHFCTEAEPYFSREQTWVKFSYTWWVLLHYY